MLTNSETQAKIAFNKNRQDIDRLIYFHQLEGGSDRGRRSENLEVLNKSAIVLICAFWEAYCEDVVSESISYMVENASSASNLGKKIKQAIAKEIKEDPHQLKAWELADEGWREFIRNRHRMLEEERNLKLNTPKSDFINVLFEQNLGISDITNQWNWQKMSSEQAMAKLDYFITLRGAIAHRGKNAETVKKLQVEDFLNHVTKIVEKTDKYVLEYLSSIS